MPKWGMVIDLDKCTACQACVVACMQRKRWVSPGRRGCQGSCDPLDGYDHDQRGRVPAHPGRTPCRDRACHCDHPPCIKVCPVNATNRSSDGIVAQIHGRCIGCRTAPPRAPTPCVTSTGIRRVGLGTWQRVERRGVGSAKGVVEKCTFCHHRLFRLVNKPHGEPGDASPGIPAGVRRDVPHRRHPLRDMATPAVKCRLWPGVLARGGCSRTWAPSPR